jgi:valyl-tRNA synthetase
LSALQRLLAPFIPFATESVWRWWQNGSVHRASWPTRAELGSTGDVAILDPIGEVLAQIRRSKTEAKTSQKTPVALASVRASAAHVAAVESARVELTDAGSVENWAFTIDDGQSTPVVEVTLSTDGTPD